MKHVAQRLMIGPYHMLVGGQRYHFGMEEIIQFSINVMSIIAHVLCQLGMQPSVISGLGLLILPLTHVDASIHSKLGHFEILTPGQLQIRTRRDTSKGSLTVKSLKFHSLGREFHLSLRQGWSSFNPDKIECNLVHPGAGSERLALDLSHLYSGSVHGRSQTSVKAFQHAGLWTAHIQDSSTYYVIEPLSVHDPRAHSMEMVIYRTSDVITHNQTNNGQSEEGGQCRVLTGKPKPSLKSRQTYTNRTQFSEQSNVNPYDQMGHSSNTNQHMRKTWKRSAEIPQHHKYHKDQQKGELACDIYQLVDYVTFKEYFKSDPYLTVKKMLFHQEKANEIFISTKFGDFSRRINTITKIDILTAYSDQYGYSWNRQPSSLVGLVDIDGFVEKLMKTHSGTKTSFCLVHLTTQISFYGKTLGAAYKGDAVKIRGHWLPDSGICSSMYNIAVTSLTLNFEIVSDLKHSLTVAHELGHSWGASHDSRRSGKTCAPSKKNGGNYLMWAYASNPDLSNSWIFSPCSRKQISELLTKIEHVCFIPISYKREDSIKNRDSSLCGNGEHDPGEECDEGFLLHDSDGFNTSCCTKSCHIKFHSTCSPTSSQCCTSHCGPAPSNQQCQHDTALPCHKRSYCDGVTTECPAPTMQPNGTECDTLQSTPGLCSKGVCVSICQAIGGRFPVKQQLTHCTCPKHIHHRCSACCRNPGLTNQCKAYPLPQRDGLACPIGVCAAGKCHTSDFFTHNYRPEFILPTVYTLGVAVLSYIMFSLLRQDRLHACVMFLFVDEGHVSIKQVNDNMAQTSIPIPPEYLTDAEGLEMAMQREKYNPI